MNVTAASRHAAPPNASVSRRLVVAAVVTFVFGMPLFFNRTSNPALKNWATILIAIVLQAAPFLVLGVLLSAMVTAFVGPDGLARVVPRRPVLAIPMATVTAAALPGCECSSVPVAGRLVNRGAPAAAALTFMLAAPAINPVVLVATSVAFPGHPEMVVARLVASAIAAMTVGLIWSRRRDAEKLVFQGHEHSGAAWERFASTMTTDFAQAGGYLVVGAALVATLQTVVPTSLMDRLGGSGAIAVAVAAGLAVIASVCSEADAFVAASLVQFSMTARLVFLVVGPMIDLKLFAMQVGSFGRRFAVFFAPLTLIVAIASAVLVAQVVL